MPEDGKFFAYKRELNQPKRECPAIPKIGANAAGRRRREGSCPSLSNMIADDLDPNMAAILEGVQLPATKVTPRKIAHQAREAVLRERSTNSNQSPA